jgi:hypothetical protein
MTALKSPVSPASPEYTEPKEDRQFESPLRSTNEAVRTAGPVVVLVVLSPSGAGLDPVRSRFPNKLGVGMNTPRHLSLK